MKYLLVFALISSSVMADPTVVALNKGDTAPFTGFLFNPEAEQKARLGVQSSDIYKERSELLESRNKILDDRVQLWMKQANDNAAVAVRNSDDLWWKQALWFGFGVVATSAAVYAAKGVIK